MRRLCLALLLAGCSGAAVPVTSPADSGTSDAGASDAGHSDAGSSDAGTDAGTSDAGTDAGASDAGTDAGTSDAGTDAGASDAGADAGSGPQASITSAPPALTNQSLAAFTFTSSIAGSTFSCAVDAARAAACTSPFSVTLADGAHSFSVTATAAGETSAPATAAWTIDTTPPDTSITSAPPAQSTSTFASISFASSESGSTFFCALDNASVSSCTSPATYSNLANGAHSFSVYAVDAARNPDATPATASWTVTASAQVKIRLLAGNLSSGNYQSYDDPAHGCAQTNYAQGEGARLIAGAKADVVMVQEFNYYGPNCKTGGNTTSDVDGLVSRIGAAAGISYTYYREPMETGIGIPNAVLSRYPIVSSGQWTDPVLADRKPTWAEIAIPGPHHLWVVSVHLHTSPASDHGPEISSVLTNLKALVPAGDYMAIGGDFNSDSQSTDPGIVALQNDFATAGPFPSDQTSAANRLNTNEGRTKPEDVLLVSKNLDPLATPVVVGAETFANGMVMDSRVFSSLGELGDIAPVLANDSVAPNSTGASTMQHMAIVRDFLVPQ